MLSSILRKARSLIATQGWTQRTCARNAAGEPCGYVEPGATLCSFGAVEASMYHHGLNRGYVDPIEDKIHGILNATCERLHGVMSYIHWQDRPERTVEEVLALFDAAIVEADAQEAQPK
jgi:hypothetical protein